MRDANIALIEPFEEPVATRLDARHPAVGQHFLNFLVQSHGLDRLAADRAAQAQGKTHERIDVVLTQLGLLNDETLLAAMADYFDMRVADDQALAGAGILLPEISIGFMRQCRLVPLDATEEGAVIAVADPFAADTIASISFLIRKPVTAVLASGRAIDTALALLDLPAAADDEPGRLDIDASAQDDDVQRLKDIASEAPIIRLVHRLIAGAVQQRASDIHVEPLVDGLRIRYRIDGALIEVERLPLEYQSGVASRIKILARLNIAERRLPQDGRTKFVVAGREIDLRVSTAPLMYGESIVLRILDQEAIDLDFKTLGFDAKAQGQLTDLLAAPNGIVLVTGPTGSGKTTTLYAGLKTLNSIERKVFTVEDPIEYQLRGVNQLQIKPSIGLDFVHCLRSILRQDPDVIMIGEMRDIETARTVIQAALTGHLVLSTLHTNSAAASVIRLLDMGLEDYLLGSTILGIVAQRLVRKLCASCAVPIEHPAPVLSRLSPDLQKFAKGLAPLHPKHPVGCTHCRQTGYRGRTTIAEILVLDEALRRKVVRGITDRDIEDVARQRGMEILIHSGLRKVMAGETTLDDVLRVART
jgi:general secretion pathway protein E